MTRYRKSEAPGSKFATAEGARRLREELDHLWRVHRPQVTRAVSEAAAQGDRSENAEYIYGKKQLREIDRRVRFLRQRLEGLVDRTALASGVRGRGLLMGLELNREVAGDVVVAGLAHAIAPYCETVDEIDDLLTLTGLRLIWERNL